MLLLLGVAVFAFVQLRARLSCVFKLNIAI